jgi:methylated-DNA-[protein]-cysteine S-methyltransferase
MRKLLRLLLDHLDTPIGEMRIVADDEGNLRAVDWTDHSTRLDRLLRRHYGEDGFKLEPAHNPHGLTLIMERYFAGEVAIIDALPIKTEGTPFQRKVWRALRTIPCGATISYAELAAQIGQPSAVRAVGLANGANPVGVVVPCHRVIGANGLLTGYGGGIERKAWLLKHESKAAAMESKQKSLFDSLDAQSDLPFTASSP